MSFLLGLIRDLLLSLIFWLAWGFSIEEMGGPDISYFNAVGIVVLLSVSGMAFSGLPIFSDPGTFGTVDKKPDTSVE